MNLISVLVSSGRESRLVAGGRGGVFVRMEAKVRRLSTSAVGRMRHEKASTQAALVQGSREASGSKGRARLPHQGIGRGGGYTDGMPNREEGGMKVIQKGKRFSASFVGGRKSGSLRSCLMAVAALLLLAAGLMTFAEAFPVKEEDKGDVHVKRSLGLEERKQIMRGVLGVMYSAEILVGGIVVCILGINGACCLCPRKDRDRLMAVLAAQRKAGAAASSAPRTSKHAFGGMALMSCLTFTMATADALQRDGDEGGGSSADKTKISEEAQRAILQGMYGTLWSFKIVFGGIIICILGLQGACCLCPQSEQSRILALQASARKAAAAKEMAAGGASAEEGKEL